VRARARFRGGRAQGRSTACWSARGAGSASCPPPGRPHRWNSSACTQALQKILDHWPPCWNGVRCGAGDGVGWRLGPAAAHQGTAAAACCAPRAAPAPPAGPPRAAGGPAPAARRAAAGKRGRDGG
jgi:hypothetical protein